VVKEVRYRVWSKQQPPVYPATSLQPPPIAATLIAQALVTLRVSDASDTVFSQGYGLPLLYVRPRQVMLAVRALIGLSSAAVQRMPESFDTSDKYLHATTLGITHLGVNKSPSNIPRVYQAGGS
jgi:hypothetical protein